MLSERHFMRCAVAALTVCVGAIAFNLRARADGVPTMSPLVYSGTLEEGGALRDGRHDLRLTVYDDAAASDASHVQCTTDAPMTPVTAGRFSVTLHADCATAVRQQPDLWIELTVDRVTLGPRTKLGAVPFALEANRASGLTPAAANALVPSGTVVAFAGGTDQVPVGWLLCDGRSFPRAMYPSLSTALGSAHGGDAMNFNLPDYRGRFLRGADNGVMPPRDPNRDTRTAANPGGNIGDRVGSLEGGATAMPTMPFGVATAGAHVHTIVGVGDHTHEQTVTANFGSGGRAIRTSYTGDGTGALQYAQGAATDGAGAHTHSMATAGDHSHSATGGDRETRPVNAAVNYIIKI